MATRRKRTATQLLISHFEKLARVSQDIDAEQAFCFRWAAQIAKHYVAKEKKIIAKSYQEGISDMSIGQFYKPKDFVEVNFI
jgi:hypothetical protein